ncbi:complement factor H-like [Eublepharis macularius]|uniref:Complement factor H-like n=1 Tax=Eublepharis macularius TaxID=481883 RepID=A0AA97JFK8_EUBMA|nr:complement factor H-like [Eublepharis macularius]
MCVKNHLKLILERCGKNGTLCWKYFEGLKPEGKPEGVQTEFSPCLRLTRELIAASCSITRQQLEAKNLLLSGGRRRSHVIGNNQTLEFLCREGYILSAPSVRKCIDGNMDLPSCISERGKNCSRPPTVANGDTITLSQKEYTSGSSVEFRCQRYYVMEGHSRSFCDNGNWTKVPVCLEPCVISLAELERRKMGVKLRSNEDEFQTLYLPHGDSVEFSCKPGHSLATNPSQSAFEIQCRGGPIVYPECKAIKCEPPRLANGTFRPERTVYQDGDLIKIECDHGVQTAEAQRIAECTRNGWSPPPQCKIVCSRPEVNNGRVNPHQEQYSHEQPVQIECDPGYKPERQGTTSKCTKDGWIPQPRCVSKLCDYPETENIEVYGVPEYYKDHYFPKRERATIYFQCINGFLSANKQAQQWQRSTCTKSGWDPEPKCFKQCDHTISFPHVKFIHGYWSKFIEGDDISFSCGTGYYPEHQEAKAKCTKNGWSPTPRCITREIPTCQRDSLPNGFFTDQKDQFALNERTRYSCRIGFTTPEGHEEGETQCRREGWTPKPECVQTCQKPTEENVIISMNKPVFFLKENLHYKCKLGYETTKKNLDDNSTCTVNGWSPSPQCLRECCSLRDKKLQWRPVTKKSLDFKSAYKKAITAEAAEQSTKDVRQLRSLVLPKKPEPVHRVDIESESEGEDKAHKQHGPNVWFTRSITGPPVLAVGRGEP